MKLLRDGITKGYLAYLEHFNLVESARLVSQNALSGQRKSSARGSSLEFSDFREYSAGDDIRRVDWNSFARSDKIYTKTYFEEKQLTINIFLDTSKSLNIDEEKGYYAKLVCASIAYIALKNNDKVNIYAFGDGLKEQKLNNISHNAFAKVVGFLDMLEFNGESSLKKTVDGSQITKGKAVIISDMFLQDDVHLAVRALRFKKQDVTMVQVLSKEEENPTELGGLRLTDCETGTFKDISVNETLILDYKRMLKEMKAFLKEVCKQNGGKFVSANTGGDIKETIKRVFG